MIYCGFCCEGEENQTSPNTGRSTEAQQELLFPVFTNPTKTQVDMILGAGRITLSPAVFTF
jgi:hypothetical protein